VWPEFYLQLNEVERAFEELKGELDAHLPTPDGREIVLSRDTQLEQELCLLLEHPDGALKADAPKGSAAENLQPRQRREFENRVMSTFQKRLLKIRPLDFLPSPVREIGLMPNPKHVSSRRTTTSQQSLNPIAYGLLHPVLKDCLQNIRGKDRTLSSKDRR
jgi:hypothetical protein